MDALPSALADILGRVVADERRAWHGDRARIEAEARATIAEYRAEIAELKAHLRTVHDGEVQALRAAVAQVHEAISMVRDGRDGEPGPPGEAGRDADPETVAALVAEHVEKATTAQVPDLLRRMVDAAVAAMPPPERGEPGPMGPQGEQGPSGEPGKDADPELIARMVAEAVAEIPTPKDGAPGPPGPAGERGEVGDPGTDGRGLADAWIGEDGTLVLALTDETEISVGPVVGPAGAPGEKGEPGASGPQGDVGPAGKDGVGLAGAMIDRTGGLVVTLTDGRTQALGIIVGKDGAPGERGEPGKDVAPELVARLVRDEVAKIPPPDPGPPGPQGAPGPAGEQGPAGIDGRDGKDADPVEVAALLGDDVAKAVADIVVERMPAPERGADGRGIKDMRLDDGLLVVELTDGSEQALGEIIGPQGEPGPPGKDGAPGERGADGEPGPIGMRGEKGDPGAAGRDAEPAVSVTDAAIDADGNLHLMLSDKTVLVPGRVVGAPGRDGADGASGSIGERGEKGEPGPPGRDGVGLAGALLDRDGSLLLTMSNGTIHDLGPVVGKDGAPGERGADGAHGRDGLSFESFVLEPEYDGERTIRLKWTDAAGKEQTRSWRLPLVIDRGIYKPGEEYEAGDATTFGGSVWIAQKATATKPGNGNPDWRLAVKSGRDGRDGKDGAKGDRGPPGPAAPGFGGSLLPGGGT